MLLHNPLSLLERHG
ncbi:hypothetical protein D030_0104A, partial [Vibrio parahaemolyticus AQ3810]